MGLGPNKLGHDPNLVKAELNRMTRSTDRRCLEWASFWITAPLTHTTQQRRQRHAGYGSTQHPTVGVCVQRNIKTRERERSKLKLPVYDMSAPAAAATGNSYCSRQFVKPSPLFVPALYKPSR
ncbi:hypothetical protein ACFE04_017490 [Oxalis oulophora]